MNIMTALFDQEEVTKALIASKEASVVARVLKKLFTPNHKIENI